MRAKESDEVVPFTGSLYHPYSAEIMVWGLFQRWAVAFSFDHGKEASSAVGGGVVNCNGFVAWECWCIIFFNEIGFLDEPHVQNFDCQSESKHKSPRAS